MKLFHIFTKNWKFDNPKTVFYLSCFSIGLKQIVLLKCHKLFCSSVIHILFLTPESYQTTWELKNSWINNRSKDSWRFISGQKVFLNIERNELWKSSSNLENIHIWFQVLAVIQIDIFLPFYWFHVLSIVLFLIYTGITQEKKKKTMYKDPFKYFTASFTKMQSTHYFHRV